MSDLDLFSDPYGSDPYDDRDRRVGHAQGAPGGPGGRGGQRGRGGRGGGNGRGGGGRGARGGQSRRGAPPGRGGRGGGDRGTPRVQRGKQRKRARNGQAAFLFAMAFLVAIVGIGGIFGYVWVDERLNPADYEGAGTGSVTIQIKDGDSGSAIAGTLVKQEVVKSSAAFIEVYGKNPKAGSIQPGYYQMRKRMSSAAAMGLLLDPKARAGNQITIPEGLRASQLVQQLAKKTGIPAKDFNRVIAKPTGLGLPDYAKGKIEGYLLPGQYILSPDTSAKEILKAMVDRFNKYAAESDLAGRAERAKMAPGTAVTMASLIQAESGKPEDMPKISRVIFNRLQHKPVPMFLKFDSTTLYGLGKFGIVASSQDIKSKNRYNTYNYAGLPPGAIGNPGDAAFDAVFEPEQGEWLFFVATDPKNRITEFAETEAEFARLKVKLDAYLAANGGD